MGRESVTEDIENLHWQEGKKETLFKAVKQHVSGWGRGLHAVEDGRNIRRRGQRAQASS